MLTALLTSLNTSLGAIVSKSFALASLLPVVLFLAACFGLANAIGGAPARLGAELQSGDQFR